MNNGKQEFVEDLLRTMVKEDHLSPKELFYAVHNVFCHGEIMEDWVNFTAEELEQAFDCFDKLFALNWG